VDFLSWFLNALHLALNGTKKKDSSIIYKTFLGHMRIYTRKIPPLELEESQRSELLNTVEYGETVTESPFLYLTCDLPPPPLFKDQFTENIIPQVIKNNTYHAIAYTSQGLAVRNSLSTYVCSLCLFIDVG
jgi:U4/U6.U5 tri-snRNP-associated protein 2